ncbi:MAG TPA: response regulator [Candidatus Omnitrophica bacterium]|nr:response regulator [Candidatus Omnitrophota bacterium]
MDDKQISVLLVDDESDFMEPIAFWLKSRGYAVSTCRNGKEAVEYIKTNAPDIVFMDINMPVMDGLEALKTIRGFNKDLPIVMVTAAYGHDEKITRAKELGISGFFAKNYTFDQLIQMIQVTLRTHKKLRPEGDKPEGQPSA